MELSSSQKDIDNRDYRPTWIGAVLLAVFSVLAQYSLPVMSYGLVFASLYSVICVLIKGRLSFNISILTFTVWCIISQLFIYILSGTFAKNQNTYFFMFVATFLLACMCEIEKESFFKVYYVFGVFFSVLVIYQFVMGNVFGVPQNAIRILPVAEEDMHFWIQNSTRASGVFTEPQAYCSYILPLLIMLLFKRRIKSAIFVSIAIFASTSSQGIIIALIIWGYYLIVYEENGKKKFFRFLGGMLVLILALLVLRNIPTFAPIIDKIFSISINGYDIRLTKGFQIYWAMPLRDKITGIGFGNLHDYLLSGKFNFFWIRLTRDELLAYITTMSNVLVSFGIVAFFLYINIFRKNWKPGTPEAKLMLIVILVSSFTQTALFNAWYVFYWVVFEVLDSYEPSRYFYILLRSNYHG